jgi:hypothetical protein
MNFLQWHFPLGGFQSLDEVRAAWPSLLEKHHLNGGYEDLRYQDALLSFLATSPLSAPFKLAATLACVSSFDLDLRLAVGLLDDALDECSTDWPPSVADAAALSGPCFSVPTADPWLAAFVVGRLAGLRDTLRHDGAAHADWRRTFWNKYLVMACRWADSDGAGRALQNGADASCDGWAAWIAAAEGRHAHALRTPHYFSEQCGQSDYLAVLDQLRRGGTELRDVSHVVLPAAAAVDNVDMLEELVSGGVSLEDAGATALVAAASNFAAGAVDWLLAHGVKVNGESDAALIGAVASLDESMVETLLAAGANLHAQVELPLCMAARAQPQDLYNGEAEFIGERADMIALLLRHGADAAHPDFAAALRAAPDSRHVIEVLARPGKLNEHARATFRAAGFDAFAIAAA